MKAVAIISGGMDSITLAYLLKEREYDLHFLTFDYGQRHRKEIGFARKCGEDLGVPFDVIDLTGIAKFLKGSALTDDVEVPYGHYAEESMKLTIVPNRNAIMLSIAFGVAVAKGATCVAIGVHAGDHFIYPDCRPLFIERFKEMEARALEGIAHIDIETPFLYFSKGDIVRIGKQLGVPFQKTWTCYEGKEHHCGKCGACNERKEAFVIARVDDPTIYAKGDAHVSNI